eukprot:TRINITY_DN774_c0_g1_i3.p2 TRINITY_DN774_c0_g1~~TRINITY_DN774_c0_g1_i3.p2  ORF type:complete len:498 (+),score=172.41 TRINITY_DN774_c0_g1_i3:2576-4069(+)
MSPVRDMHVVQGWSLGLRASGGADNTRFSNIINDRGVAQRRGLGACPPQLPPSPPMSVQDLLKTLTPDEASISAYTLLAETVGAREFVKALDSRLRGADAEEKLAFWCLIDSLLKAGREELREQLWKALPGYVLRQIPWDSTEDVARYMALLHSWEAVLPAEVMADVEHSLKDSLFALCEREARASKDEKAKSRDLFPKLYRASVPAARKRTDASLWQVHHRTSAAIGEQLLVTVDPPAKSSRAARARQKAAEKKEAEETAAAAAAAEGGDVEMAPGGDEDGADAGRRESDAEDEDDESIGNAAPHALLPKAEIVHAAADELDVHNTAAIVKPLYTLGTMCPTTGFRFADPNDMADHKDHVIRFRNSDERMRRCRMWHRTPEEWNDVLDTKFGQLCFESREKLVGMSGGKDARSLHDVHSLKQNRKRLANAVTPDLIKVSDAATVHRCVVCQDKFEKRVLRGEWYLVDAVRITNMKDPNQPWRRVTGLAHTSCVGDM